MDRKEEIRQKIKECNEQVFQLEKELDDIFREEHTKEEYEMFKNFQFEIVSKNVLIIRGGLNYTDPIKIIDNVIDDILKKSNIEYCTCFVEETLDNPWVRVVIFNTEELKFEDTFNDVIEKLKQ